MTHESDLFDRVQTDRNICNNCFRRTHDEWERNYAVDNYRDAGETKLWARQVELPNDRVPKHAEVADGQGDTVTDGVYAICKCGGTNVRPLPKSDFLRACGRLVDRYHEMGVSVKRQRLIDIARELKSDPDEQFADDRLFAQATELTLVESVRPSGDGNPQTEEQTP